MPSESWNYY